MGPTKTGRQGVGDVPDVGPAGRPTEDHADDRVGLVGQPVDRGLARPPKGGPFADLVSELGRVGDVE
eukprot:15453336-Alexandrium_andersonii.AAC.1